MNCTIALHVNGTKTSMVVHSQKQTTEKQWIVVQVKPHKELLAIINLKRQNFSCYCPMMERQVNQRQHRIKVKRPLFPGYLFVGVCLKHQILHPIRSTLGVTRIMGSQHNPSCLQEEFIKELQDREVNGVILKPAHPYHEGQEVQLFGGAFDGLIATILDLDDKGRITVLMELLNQNVRIKTDVLSIRPV